MKITKKQVAQVVGATAVGIAGAWAIKEVAGRAVEQSLVGAIVLMIAHEALNAPVSNWVYDQI
jgi:hypothetical protein